MIRTSQPTPLRPFTLRWDWLTRRTRRTLEQRRRALRADALQLPQDNYLMVRWREELARKREAFVAFRERYESLVDLLCLAAQYGIKPHWEEEYREHRAWFIKRYSSVKRELTAHLVTDAHDSAPGIWGRRSCDAFEAMFLPTSLKSLLAHDGGKAIERMERTHNAIAAYEAQLTRDESASGFSE